MYLLQFKKNMIRNGRQEMTPMAKFIFTFDEIAKVIGFLKKSVDEELKEVLYSVRKTIEPYSPKYPDDPKVEGTAYSFILFPEDGERFIRKCVLQMFPFDEETKAYILKKFCNFIIK